MVAIPSLAISYLIPETSGFYGLGAMRPSAGPFFAADGFAGAGAAFLAPAVSVLPGRFWDFAVSETGGVSTALTPFTAFTGGTLSDVSLVVGSFVLAAGGLIGARAIWNWWRGAETLVVADEQKAARKAAAAAKTPAARKALITKAEALAFRTAEDAPAKAPAKKTVSHLKAFVRAALTLRELERTAEGMEKTALAALRRDLAVEARVLSAIWRDFAHETPDPLGGAREPDPGRLGMAEVLRKFSLELAADLPVSAYDGTLGRVVSWERLGGAVADHGTLRQAGWAGLRYAARRDAFCLARLDATGDAPKGAGDAVADRIKATCEEMESFLSRWPVDGGEESGEDARLKSKLDPLMALSAYHATVLAETSRLAPRWGAIYRSVIGRIAGAEMSFARKLEEAGWDEEAEDWHGMALRHEALSLEKDADAVGALLNAPRAEIKQRVH